MVYYLRVRGLTASSYIVYDYTTNGHTKLYSIYVLYTECARFHKIYLFISSE